MFSAIVKITCWNIIYLRTVYDKRLYQTSRWAHILRLSKSTLNSHEWTFLGWRETLTSLLLIKKKSMKKKRERAPRRHEMIVVVNFRTLRHTRIYLARAFLSQHDGTCDRKWATESGNWSQKGGKTMMKKEKNNDENFFIAATWDERICGFGGNCGTMERESSSLTTQISTKWAFPLV